MIEVEWHNDEFSLYAKVFPFGKDKDNWRTSITVDRQSSFSNELRNAEVNWPAIGAQSQEIARQFADGLIEASKIARDMMYPVYKYKIEGSYLDEKTNEFKQFSIIKLGNNEEQIRNSLHGTTKNMVINKVA